nr:retrovirus-related Pol polyprotein from transposon TNT 1-94 [Tanacetum cinerariifolium]
NTPRTPYSTATHFGGVTDSGEEDDEKVKEETYSGEEDDEKVKEETCLIYLVLLLYEATRPDEWINDSGCSNHITGNRKRFSTYKAYNEGLWYPKGTGIETIVYVDSDHAGDYVDKKSTSGICTFLECCLTYWFAEKQTDLAISTIEAKYVSVRKACQQELWMKQALIDYDIRLDDIPNMCNNKSVIDLSKNMV